MIVLLHFGNKFIDWEFGPAIQLQHHANSVDTAISQVLEQENDGWIFFWDFNLGAPNVELLSDLIGRPVDAWHAGLKRGLGDLPDVLNNVHPTWMYNRNGPVDREHTSFRLSINAALIRIDLLRKTGLVSTHYSSLAMYGIALGYKLLKSGAIVRYIPMLAASATEVSSIPEKDEWVFAREFFSQKWQLWSLFNRRRFISNLKNWAATISVKPGLLRPVIHSSRFKLTSVRYETVSVLAPTLNRYSYLLNELNQLSKQTILPLEVLITDQTEEADRMYLDFGKFPNLTVRYFPQKEKGQCLAWNKLLQEAKGDYVLFLGDDADDIKPDFIEKLLSTMQQFNCDMVASNVVEIGVPAPPPKSLLLSFRYFPDNLNKTVIGGRCRFHGHVFQQEHKG